MFSLVFVFLAVFGINCLYGYVFPMKYSEEISYASQKYGVDEAVIYSMINIESHFNKSAVSSKGAVGLMQVMPSTAEMVANNLNIQEIDLTIPQQNIEIGTAYISSLLNRFKNLETALCAYNAGPTNVSSWLKNKDYSKDGESLDSIPFEETRNYVTKFLRNYNYYKTKKQA